MPQLDDVIPTWLQSKQGASVRSSYFLKRPLNVLLGMVALLISTPLWAILAIVIKVEDRGPVFFCRKGGVKIGVGYLFTNFVLWFLMP